MSPTAPPFTFRKGSWEQAAQVVKVLRAGTGGPGAGSRETPPELTGATPKAPRQANGTGEVAPRDAGRITGTVLSAHVQRGTLPASHSQAAKPPKS